MFQQAIFILGIFMFGLISSQDLLMPKIEKPDDSIDGINGIISINSTIIKEISHQSIEYELGENVNGMIHYAIGARTSREYGIFWYYLCKWVRVGMGKFVILVFISTIRLFHYHKYGFTWTKARLRVHDVVALWLFNCIHGEFSCHFNYDIDAMSWNVLMFPFFLATAERIYAW